MNFDLPGDTIGEITVIGTGGGYGESCVVHLGMQKWIVVDSCIDPDAKKSLPLEYLEKIGVNVESNVLLVLCTHWHNDHILGLSKLLKKCHKAKFSFAKANDKVKFLQLVSLDYHKIKKDSTCSSLEEFQKCYDICLNRATTPVMAYPDRTLLSSQVNKYINQVISLSPSDNAIHNFDLEISTLITDYGKSNLKIPSPSPNFYSVALYIKLGDHRVILGGDLEVSNNDKSIGWYDVTLNSQVFDKKASFLKIPHHGSKNAYHDDLWIHHLDKKTKSNLTPWNQGSKLPDLQMKALYKSKSDEIYITSDIQTQSRKPKKRDRIINNIIRDFKIILEEVPYKHGLIRSRIDMEDINATWDISCEGTASKL